MVVIGIVLLLYVGLHYLLYKKMVSILFKINKKIIGGVLIFLSSSYILYMIMGQMLYRPIRLILAYCGSFYLGFLFYLILFFILSEIIKKLFKKDVYLIAFVLALFMVPIGHFFQQNIQVKHVSINSDKINEEYTIAVLSDLHLGDLIKERDFNRMIDKVNQTQPDVILIAGDIIDSNLDYVLETKSLELFKEFESRLGVYVTLGNHDLYTDQVDRLTLLLEDQGVHVLNDESVIKEELLLIGRKDVSFKGKDLMTSNEDKYSIVLDHTPSRINESYNKDIDLHVSGHTHNGQLFPLNYIVDALFEVGYGYKNVNGTDVIVSGGIGSWGPMMRTSSFSEFTLVELRK